MTQNEYSAPWYLKYLALSVGILVGVIIISTIAPDVVQTIFGVDTYSEYHEYLSIRDYSNCTKENDTACTERSGCVHMYRQCQIDHCGSKGVGW